MTHENKAASMTKEEVVALLKSHEELALRVAWFERQLFGTKSERRIMDDPGRQLTLGEIGRTGVSEPPEIEIPAHRRRRKKPLSETDQSLRFDPSVPVEEIIIENKEIKNSEDYTVVDEKVTCRLAQRPGSYVVLRYVRKVYKRKDDATFSCAPAPPAVFEKSYADVSFLAGLLIDKFIYHLPLYRQHQRLEAAGVHLARSTLTNLVHRTALLLEPIYDAQLGSILASKVLALDETPIKAGHKKRPPPQRGKMKTGYFWPLYGDRDEIAFSFAETRGKIVVENLLKDYSGVLLTDGYEVYERYVEKINGIVHALCWVHTRRYFDKAESMDPKRAGEALAKIALLYEIEAAIKPRGFSPEKVLAKRTELAKPIVDDFFEWLRETLNTEILLPSNPFTEAARYALAREDGLRVFLEYPDVQLDTNHLERAIRVIAMGRKNYLFCWTEIGAKYVGIIQSLLSTCRVQGIDPYTYLVDVLQRIDTHPAREVELLTPRMWKERFAGDPRRSDIDRIPARNAIQFTTP
ncbi:MAG: IS66 family transposase [Candidatus Eisenbacteria bacterium]|uniref:IS66 family transposase n=1 Tax=Eiseniibacteriota bacterium TaxID=2212470 RepID=A0A948RX97_UNCEI|nr:IS66 family transposase [Candidatus Eisenbacteria bacterium]